MSLDLRTGHENWRITTKTWGGMASDGGHLFVFTLDSKRATRLGPRLTAYSLSSGQEIWVGKELPQLSDASFGYGPILLAGTLYASDATGNTIAVDPATGKQQWQYPEESFPAASSGTRGEDLPSSSMIGIDNAIYVVTASKTLVKLDRQTGEQLASTNLIDRFGSDIRSITLQASGTELLVSMQRTATAGSDDGKTPSMQRTTIARLSSTDLSLEWQSGRGAIGGNLVSLPNALFVSKATEGHGAFLTSVSDPTGQSGGVNFPDAPYDSASLMGVAGSTLIAYDNENTVTFSEQATDLSDAAPDTMLQFKGKRILVILPGPAGPATIPPLLWGKIPVIVTANGMVWSFPKEPVTQATPDLTPSEIPAESSALSQNAVRLTMHVYVDGVLNDDPAAIATARAELDRVLAPYVNGSNCQIGFALIQSHAFDVDQGVQLSDKIASMIGTDHPELLPTGADGMPARLVSDSIAIPGTASVGDVEIQLFFNIGCQPAPATPIAQ
ncbi:MAG: PQQ-binding-like beta-propeller repeat protein [Thermomicrobiales bacterium]